MNGTIEFLDHKKHRPTHQNHHPKWFSSQAMIKNIFCKIVANEAHWHMSHLQTTQVVFLLI